MKKGIIALITALSLALCACGSSKGSDSTGEENLGGFVALAKDGVIDMPSFGIKIKIPSAWKDAGLDVRAVGFVSLDYGYANICLNDPKDADNNNLTVANINAQRDPISVESLISDDTDDGLEKDDIKIIGDNGTFYYYGIDIGNMDKHNHDLLVSRLNEIGLTQEQIDSVSAAWKNDNELYESVEIKELKLPPVPTASSVNSTSIMNMTAKDIDGNDVDLGKIISSNKVVMINVWGTFCGPCINEMPFVNELYEKYKDQGFFVIGLTTDVLDSNDQPIDMAIQDGLDIRDDLDINYLLIRETSEMKGIFATSTYPTTYFIDSKGEMIGDPILGARTDSVWDKMINEKLSEVN